MAETQWTGFAEKISGEEKLLPRGIYKLECTGARPFQKDGEVRRGLFLDFEVIAGPQKGEFITTYVNVPEPGDRRAGFWYLKKMAGFGDLSSVYDDMPEDLEGGLNYLCANLVGRTLLGDIGPGNGDYSKRNALNESKVLEATPGPAAEAELELNGEDETGDGSDAQPDF